MTIALAKDVEDFLREQVRSGVAGDPSESANDVLRCVRDQQHKPFGVCCPPPPCTTAPCKRFTRWRSPP